MQFLRRYLADETQGKTGIKVNDFGTGGRVYKRRYRQHHRSSTSGGLDIGYGGGGKLGFFVFACLSTFALWWAESGLANTYAVLDESLRGCEQGVLAYISGAPSFGDTAPLRDPFTNMRFAPEVAVARRVAEYCQWAEVPTVHRAVVGREPDYCAARAGADRERCGGGGQCRGRAARGCADDCCELRPGADVVEESTTFNYHKAWRPSRIDSNLFDNPIAYRNPTRDPAPSVTFWHIAGPVHIYDAAKGRTFSVDARDVETALGPWTRRNLFRGDVDRLGEEALEEGFAEADHRHFYSRVPKDGVLTGLAKLAGAYLVDGVVDASAIARGTGIEALLGGAGLGWITAGTCNAGDVRVRFEQRALPASLTALGSARGPNTGMLMKHTYQPVEILQNTFFQIERAALHSYGPGPHSG